MDKNSDLAFKQVKMGGFFIVVDLVDNLNFEEVIS